MLVETLIVATFLVTTLLFIYVQFNNINKSYDNSFRYNTVNGLYTAKNIIKYISTDGIDRLKTAMVENDLELINITNCSNEYFTESNYCSILINSSNIKTVLFTRENLSSLKDKTTNLDQTMVDFIEYINYEETLGYRVIIEFNDNTFATLKI